MTSFAVVRVGDCRVAAVLVERRDLVASGAYRRIRWLEEELMLPVMLVARDDSHFFGARAWAEFDAKPFLYALIRAADIEWTELETNFNDETRD